MIFELISVVIPTRNRLVYLKEAVASVLSQDYGNLEIIIVDDASEDETPVWLSQISHPCVRTLRMQERVERSAARNRGLALAQGKFILFLDDDDRLRPRALTHLARRMACRPHAAAIVGGVMYFSSAERIRWPHPRVCFCRIIWPEVLGGWWAGSGRVLWQREVLVRAGGWNESLISMEDRELILRVSRHAPFAFCPRSVCEVRLHSGQTYPQDCLAVTRKIFADFVADLPPADRRRAERVLKSRDIGDRAWEQHRNGSYLSALKLGLHAVSCFPESILSPIMAVGLWCLFSRSVAGIVLGRFGLSAVRRFKALVRRALHRDVFANPTATSLPISARRPWERAPRRIEQE